MDEIIKLSILTLVSFLFGVFLERNFGEEKIIYVYKENPDPNGEKWVTCKTCEEGVDNAIRRIQD